MKRFEQGDPPPQNVGSRRYRKTAVVSMWGPMPEPFQTRTREGWLDGETGDFIAADGHGGYYPISPEFHAANYEEAE